MSYIPLKSFLNFKINEAENNFSKNQKCEDIKILLIINPHSKKHLLSTSVSSTIWTSRNLIYKFASFSPQVGCAF